MLLLKIDRSCKGQEILSLWQDTESTGASDMFTQLRKRKRALSLSPFGIIIYERVTSLGSDPELAQKYAWIRHCRDRGGTQRHCTLRRPHAKHLAFFTWKRERPRWPKDEFLKRFTPPCHAPPERLAMNSPGEFLLSRHAQLYRDCSAIRPLINDQCDQSRVDLARRNFIPVRAPREA